MARQYCFIFSRLVSDPGDLLGLMAYGIYKQEKIDFIRDWEKNNGGCAPDDSDLAAFHNSSLLRINQYKTLAEHRMEAFMEAMLEERRDIFELAAKEGEKAALNDIVQSIYNTVHSLRPGFWSQVRSGIVGNTSFLVVLIGAALLLSAFDLPGTIIAFCKELFAATLQ